MNRYFAKKGLAIALALLVTTVGWLTQIMSVENEAYAAELSGDTDTGIISTYAGGPGAGPATNVGQMPFGLLATDKYVYVPDRANFVVRRIDKATSEEIVVAGNGTYGNSGDGGAAINAQLAFPWGLAIDSQGNLYIADNINHNVRKVDLDGKISTVDLGAAYTLTNPTALAVDQYDALYIADTGNGRVLKVAAADGSVIELATGLQQPKGLAVDISGHEPIVYVADAGKNAIYSVYEDGNDPIIKTIIGAVVPSPLNNPHGLAIDSDHNLYIADAGNKAVRKVNTQDPLLEISTVPTDPFALKSAFGVAVGSNGELYVADTGSFYIYLVSNGVVSIIGGNGEASFGGDGGPAVHARFNEPSAAAVDGAGNVYIADYANKRVRKVDAATGIVTTIAGTGKSGYAGDGTPATEANLSNIDGVVVDNAGNVFILDSGENLVFKVDAVTKKISTVAELNDTGTGMAIDNKGILYIALSSGIEKLDPATGDIDVLLDSIEKQIYTANGIAADSKGNVYFIDASKSDKLAKIDAHGNVSYIEAGFNGPYGMAVDRNDNVYVADAQKRVVYKVDSGGEIAAAAGTPGSSGYSGDGGPANAAYLSNPAGVAVDMLSGDFYIADPGNANIRKVDMPAIPALALNASAAAGSAYGTTSVTAAVYEGHHLAVQVSSTTISTPMAGDMAPTGAGVASPYTSGANIGGVDAATNKYVGVYDVNGYGRVVSFKQITLTAAEINNSQGGGWTGDGVVVPPNDSKSVKIVVDGKELGDIATGEETKADGKTAFTVKLNADKLSALLAKAGDKPVIVIPVTSAADKVSVLLTGDAVKALENKQAMLDIRTPNGNYSLPAAEVLIDSLAKKLDGQAKLADIMLQVYIAKSDPAIGKLLEAAAAIGHFKVVAAPVEFSVAAVHKGKSVEVEKFASYVKREIPLIDGASRNVTAIVMDPSGAVRHVPTQVKVHDGKPYAMASSLTNSTYAVISYQAAFADVEGHWSRDAVTDMASRLVISGADEAQFKPDAAITRAEFAALIVRALGFADSGSTGAFADVKAGQWFAGAVAKAQEHGIISGYEDGTFRPMKTITRAEAMAMMARAMELAGLEAAISSEEADAVLSAFKDGQAVDAWAKQAVAATVKSGLVSGSDKGLLPGSDITRAETASIVQRLLKQAKLID